jgi:hypothetical protein
MSASAPFAPDEQSQTAQVPLPPLTVTGQDTTTTGTSQSNTLNQTLENRSLKVLDCLSTETRHVSQSAPTQHSQNLPAYPTPKSAAHRNFSVAPDSEGEVQEYHSASGNSYQTQPTLLLDPVGVSSGRTCGTISQSSQKCVDETKNSQYTAQSVHLEKWLESQDITEQAKSSNVNTLLQPNSTYVESEATTEWDDASSFSSDDPNCLPDHQQLQNISNQLHAQRNTGPNKSNPIGQPEVWAEGRQELCETLHYYRSYQGACYSTGGFVRGFMFDKVAHNRDYLDGNVIISRAGGGLTKDKDSGEMRAGKDQVEDSVALGLKNCILHRNPVVIIAGIDNPHIPSKPPHQYCVLGSFKPTHVWSEKSGAGKILRYRFEKLNTKKESWWQAKDGPEALKLGSLPKPVEKTCDTCGIGSQQVYINGWMCLQPTYRSFWKMVVPTPSLRYNTSFLEPNEASLIYDPRFLKQKTIWENDEQEHPLVSNIAELSEHSLPGEDTSVAFWSGIVCPKCGRCISRLNWTNWRCSNTTCDYKRSPPHTLISALSLRDPLWPVADSYTLSRDTISPLIGFSVRFEHGYRINRHTLPGIEGFITHMIANKTVLEETGGPDAMFEELQQTDIGLQRRPLPNGQLKGPSYCRQFLVNYGMPYKFVAATQSHSFDGAARPITSTRSRLNWVAKYLLMHETGKSMQEVSEEWQDKEFNEVLALGYFQEQKINYHDDGEFGLGPTIATLSLGAPGTMRIRMKTRRYHGVSCGAGLYDDAIPIPGCEHYTARLALQPALDALKASNNKAYNARRKQIPKELGLNSRGHAKDTLVMQLGHGDIVVMHGAGIQKYYEHSVEHAGRLRFALTCRYIDPSH